MTPEQHNAWPLPPMDKEQRTHSSTEEHQPSKPVVLGSNPSAFAIMPDDAEHLDRFACTAGGAGVVGAPPHQSLIDPASAEGLRQAGFRTDAQRAYEAHRRAHAEAIGRPYPEARHAVWPR